MFQVIRGALGTRKDIFNLLLLAVLLLVVCPLGLGIFQLNLLGKYLSLAFVAVGLVICWGYGGALSLGQGVFWGLGGYCMAAFLKLEAAHDILLKPNSDAYKALSTPGIPDFMDWNQLKTIPWFWQPFHSLPLTLILIFALPTILAYIIGTAVFKRRVTGVYFAIITQALAWIMEMMFITRQGWTGGVNGITAFKTFLGWNINTNHAQLVIYLVTAVLLMLSIIACRYILSTKLGRLLVALRDEEDRVRFSGYDVASFKTFAFCVAAIIGALGGAMYVFNVGMISPKEVAVGPSIVMVVFCAVGGRTSLIGAIYGTILICVARSYMSDEIPFAWSYVLGGVFIVVSRFFPEGIAGITDNIVGKVLAALKKGWNEREKNRLQPVLRPPSLRQSMSDVRIGA